MRCGLPVFLFGISFYTFKSVYWPFYYFLRTVISLPWCSRLTSRYHFVQRAYPVQPLIMNVVCDQSTIQLALEECLWSIMSYECSFLYWLPFQYNSHPLLWLVIYFTHGIFEQARASIASKPRTPEGPVRSMTTVRKSIERPTLSVRDSLDKMHQSYSEWNEYVGHVFRSKRHVAWSSVRLGWKSWVEALLSERPPVLWSCFSRIVINGANIPLKCYAPSLRSQSFLDQRKAPSNLPCNWVDNGWRKLTSTSVRFYQRSWWGYLR